MKSFQGKAKNQKVFKTKHWWCFLFSFLFFLIYIIYKRTENLLNCRYFSFLFFSFFVFPLKGKFMHV